MERYKRRSEEEWAELIQAQAQSDQSMVAFCQARQINKHTFNYWRAKLRQVEEEPPGFITLRPPKNASGVLVLRLGAGLTLELPVDYPASALSQLIRELQC